MAGAWEQERERGPGGMLQDAEQVQPLRPDAVWPQHPPSVSDSASVPDPGTHANSAFAPPQPPYADGNAMALLQQWWAYYAQQRPLQPGHQPHNGAVPGAFASVPAGDHSSLHSALPHLLSSIGPKAETSGHTFAHPSAVSVAHSVDVQAVTAAGGSAAAQLPVNTLKTNIPQEQAGTDGTGNSMMDASASMGEPRDGSLAEAAAGNGSGELGSRGSGAKCPKEKNRQAQRRFRERQKGLISTLKDRNDALTKQVEEQSRALEALEKENMLLKAMLGDAAKAPLMPPHIQAQMAVAPPQAMPPQLAANLPDHHTQQAQLQGQQLPDAQQLQYHHQQQQQQQQQQHLERSVEQLRSIPGTQVAVHEVAAARDVSPQTVHLPSQRQADVDAAQEALQQQQQLQPEPLTQAPTNSP